MSIAHVDLSEEPEHLELLSRFYDQLFTEGFPDANEREALGTFEVNLQKRAKKASTAE